MCSRLFQGNMFFTGSFQIDLYTLLRKEEISVKVFDFDNTIYKGESSVDFSFYMIRHNRKILRYVPTILFSLAGYKLCLLSRQQLESIINDFIAGVLEDTAFLSAFVKSFWEKHACKLNENILRLIAPEDVIISASPVFLIRGIGEKLNTEKIIGTDVDFERKKIIWFNFGDNKVKRYRELYGNCGIDAFYTDSYNDKDMMDISGEVYIMKRGIPVRLS